MRRFFPVAGVVLISLIILAPCFWQSRIQAGDLSSHIYNAWLAKLIQDGGVPGLEIAGQKTNVAFDLILWKLFVWFGAGPAQTIAVSLCVLVFFWGSFAFVSAASDHAAWNWVPILAILTYGWVFHIGFFNFYLSLGLCFWALALLRRQSKKTVIGAIFLLAFAFTAHALPVAWTVAVYGYSLLLARLSPKWGLILLGASVASIFLTRLLLMHAFETRWSTQQILLVTGADQAWIYDTKYVFCFIGIFLFWILAFVRTAEFGWRNVFGRASIHFAVLTAAIVFLIPTTIFLSGYHHALAYISERMSLPLGVCLCAALTTRTPRALVAASSLLAMLFFGMLYYDERFLNVLEDRIDAAMLLVAPRTRVILGITDSSPRINPVTHMLDRACTGRCYSYANYEASTAAFRIRAIGPNGIVASTYGASWGMQTGGYIVEETDQPLYQLNADGRGRFYWLPLSTGQTTSVIDPPPT